MQQLKAKIISNNKVSADCGHCVLSLPGLAGRALPGQFVNVKVSDGCEPLLRRPLSIHRASGKNIELLYKVLGPGTKALSQKKPGEYLDLIGPLGNGLNYQLPITNYRLPILVAGGMGVAPLVFLAEKLAEIQNPSRKSGIPQRTTQGAGKSQILVLIGAKSKKDILCDKEFKKLGCDVKIATDDGSRGFKGKITDLLKYLLLTIDYRLSTIYACGPRPMLKALNTVAREYNIPAQVSLEEHMSCGFGACLGCVVQTKSGYKRVCKEGPVFNASEIIW